MLLKKSLSAQAVALGYCLMFGLTYMSPAAAGIPPVSAPASSTVSVVQSQAQISAAFPHGSTPFYLKNLTPLYAANGMRPMWQDQQAVQQFQQQLAEVALSGVQPQFTRWVKQLTDPQISGLAGDEVLSDALFGDLQLTSNFPSKIIRDDIQCPLRV